MNSLNDAVIRKNYTIKDIETNDEELKNFLLSLGYFNGEIITVINKKINLIVVIKDAKYCIDKDLAEIIKINHQ